MTSNSREKRGTKRKQPEIDDDDAYSNKTGLSWKIPELDRLARLNQLKVQSYVSTGDPGWQEYIKSQQNKLIHHKSKPGINSNPLPKRRRTNHKTTNKPGNKQRTDSPAPPTPHRYHNKYKSTPKKRLNDPNKLLALKINPSPTKPQRKKVQNPKIMYKEKNTTGIATNPFSKGKTHIYDPNTSLYIQDIDENNGQNIKTNPNSHSIKKSIKKNIPKLQQQELNELAASSMSSLNLSDDDREIDEHKAPHESNSPPTSPKNNKNSNNRNHNRKSHNQKNNNNGNSHNNRHPNENNNNGNNPPPNNNGNGRGNGDDDDKDDKKDSDDNNGLEVPETPPPKKKKKSNKKKDKMSLDNGSNGSHGSPDVQSIPDSNIPPPPPHQQPQVSNNRSNPPNPSHNSNPSQRSSNIPLNPSSNQNNLINNNNMDISEDPAQLRDIVYQLKENQKENQRTQQKMFDMFMKMQQDHRHSMQSYFDKTFDKLNQKQQINLQMPPPPHQPSSRFEQQILEQKEFDESRSCIRNPYSIKSHDFDINFILRKSTNIWNAAETNDAIKNYYWVRRIDGDSINLSSPADFLNQLHGEYGLKQKIRYIGDRYINKDFIQEIRMETTQDLFEMLHQEIEDDSFYGYKQYREELYDQKEWNKAFRNLPIPPCPATLNLNRLITYGITWAIPSNYSFYYSSEDVSNMRFYKNIKVEKPYQEAYGKIVKILTGIYDKLKQLNMNAVNQVEKYIPVKQRQYHKSSLNRNENYLHPMIKNMHKNYISECNQQLNGETYLLSSLRLKASMEVDIGKVLSLLQQIYNTWRDICQPTYDPNLEPSSEFKKILSHIEGLDILDGDNISVASAFVGNGQVQTSLLTQLGLKRQHLSMIPEDNDNDDDILGDDQQQDDDNDLLYEDDLLQNKSLLSNPKNVQQVVDRHHETLEDPNIDRDTGINETNLVLGIPDTSQSNTDVNWRELGNIDIKQYKLLPKQRKTLINRLLTFINTYPERQDDQYDAPQDRLGSPYNRFDIFMNGRIKINVDLCYEMLKHDIKPLLVIQQRLLLHIQFLASSIPSFDKLLLDIKIKKAQMIERNIIKYKKNLNWKTNKDNFIEFTRDLKKLKAKQKVLNVKLQEKYIKIKRFTKYHGINKDINTYNIPRLQYMSRRDTINDRGDLTNRVKNKIINRRQRSRSNSRRNNRSRSNRRRSTSTKRKNNRSRSQNRKNKNNRGRNN